MAFINYSKNQKTTGQSNIMYYLNIKTDQNPGWALPNGFGGGMFDYVAIKTMQGIINREAPRLFLDDNLIYYKDSDYNWRQILEQEGYCFVELKNVGELFEVFHESFQGIVTYRGELNVNGHFADADMAAVLGSLTDRIPIHTAYAKSISQKYHLPIEDEVTLTDSFAYDKHPDKTVTARLEQLKWKTSAEAIQWGYENLLPYCSPYEYHNMCEESMDFMASRKMFYAYIDDAQPEHTDLFRKILSWYGDRNNSFPIWGWYATEDSGISIASKYGGLMQCAGSTNLSFLDKLPAEHQNLEQVSHETLEYDPNKYYVTVMAAENDAVRTVTTLQHGAWLESSRGKNPINWGFESFLIDVIPFVGNYYYKTATKNDYFFSGGASPLGFVDFDALPLKAREEVIAKGSYYMQRTDQKMLDLYSCYGAIGPYDFDLYQDMAQRIGLSAISYDEAVFNDPIEYFGNIMGIPRELYQYRFPSLEALRGYDDVLEAYGEDFSTDLEESWQSVNGTVLQGSVENIDSIDLTDMDGMGFCLYTGKKDASYLNLIANVFCQDNNGGKTGVVFRYQDDENYYFCGIENGTVAKLEKVENGESTVLGEVDGSFWSVTTNRIKVVANGTSIKCYIGDSNKKICDVTDEAFFSGQVGIAGNAAMSATNIGMVFTTQAQQVINSILSKTIRIDAPKPSFTVGLYTDIFSDNHERVQWGSEPHYGQNSNISISPTELMQVYEYFEKNYPGQFEFVTLEQYVQLQQKYRESTHSGSEAAQGSDKVAPYAARVGGIVSNIPQAQVNCLNLAVYVTENEKISRDAVTLKWKVEGKSGVGNALLQGKAEQGIDIPFEAYGIDLANGIQGGVQKGDVVSFWVEGQDQSANAFNSYVCSEEHPIATYLVGDYTYLTDSSGVILDDDQYRDWLVTEGDNSYVEKTNNGVGKTSCLKLNAAKEESPKATLNFMADARNHDGLSVWLKSDALELELSVEDLAGNTASHKVSNPANEWQPYYVSMGELNKQEISKISVKITKGSETGESTVCCIDNPILIKASNIAGNQDFTGFFSDTYNSEEVKGDTISYQLAVIKPEENHFVARAVITDKRYGLVRIKMDCESENAEVFLTLYDNTGKFVVLNTQKTAKGQNDLTFKLKEIEKSELDTQQISGVRINVKSSAKQMVLFHEISFITG